MRNLRLSEGEYYHIYNRAVDKRNYLLNNTDLDRFLSGLTLFNTSRIIGSLDRTARRHRVSTVATPRERGLVEFVAYALNPNHFHLLLRQATTRGIEKFMHKLSMGFAKYFNTKYKRNGALFQGRFRAKHIDTNEYLLHLSAYINLNDLVHARHGESLSLNATSWDEYINDRRDGLCNKEIVLGQFRTRGEYQKFAEESLEKIIGRKILLDELGVEFR